MSYDLKNEDDPWYIMPLFIILILGLIVWGVSASVKYVEEEGYKTNGALINKFVESLPQVTFSSSTPVTYAEMELSPVHSTTTLKILCDGVEIKSLETYTKVPWDFKQEGYTITK